MINGKYHNDKNKFRSIYENLITYNDEFFVLQDFDSYLKAQDKIIDICKKLEARVYINSIGGQELYNKEKFKEENNKHKIR